MGGLLSFVFATIFVTTEVSAIPAWARKYKTTCATCHISYPKLNAFGRAFMMNGYQFPGGVEADKEQAKEKPVSMGSEAYKRVWPDAIWPNALPATVPLAVVVENAAVYLPNAPAGEPKLSFGDFPEEVEVLSGGNFSDNISFFAELAFEGGEAELEMAHISFDNILPNNALSLKVGKIVPFVTPFSNMRHVTTSYWYATLPLGDNAWNFDRTQRGVEARGLLSQGRLIYSAGLVEGRENEFNGDKDFYFHLGYKFGGLRLDGIREAASAGPTQPWQDNSIRFDAFYYNGRATLTGGQKDNFSQFGGSVDLYYNRLNLSGLVAVQNDDKPVVGETFDGTGTHIMTEATYVLYPWLLPTVRYEWFKAELGPNSDTSQRFVPGLIALIRANVKLQLNAEIEKEAGEGEFEFGEVELGLIFGF
ncbi:MAG: hypothetical protein D6814_04585 [Calditrichaeota bacterium]|nr:MAG: hypothetical protein D6814_04585 [Calditrichota bacterium]